jgi:hypothetical protein
VTQASGTSKTKAVPLAFCSLAACNDAKELPTRQIGAPA